MNFLALAFFLTVLVSDQNNSQKEIVGVFQGKSVFIQNPYNPEIKEFCIDRIYVNDRPLKINYNVSAIKVDFINNDLYTPVKILIVSRDSTCQPLILNPDAIRFHTSYKFKSINLSDSALVWKTEGERETGTYQVERLQDGLWTLEAEVPAKGQFEEARYSYEATLEEGTNKFRIKYLFGNGRYLYSPELDYEFYPEPVSFQPKRTSDEIILSRPSQYEIYDQGGKMILSGQGSTIDVSFLYPGDYVIYFDGKDPGVFTRTEN